MQNNDWEKVFGFLKEDDFLDYSKYLEERMLYTYSRIAEKVPKYLDKGPKEAGIAILNLDDKLPKELQSWLKKVLTAYREDKEMHSHPYPDNLSVLVRRDCAFTTRNVREEWDSVGHFKPLDLNLAEFFPLALYTLEEFDAFFLLFRPNLLFLDKLSHSDSIELDYEYFPMIVAYFSLFEVLDKSPGFEYNQYAPGELYYTFKNSELKEIWKNKWKNPNFSRTNFKNVSKEVQNILLKDDKIENLFANIFDELNYTALKGELNNRLLPTFNKGTLKNLFPVVKERVEKNLPYMNYLYLEEEEKQPEEVKEVNKPSINVANLVEEKSGHNFKEYFPAFYKTTFYLILLDIMFSQILQELFKEYEFYHKKILTLAPAILEGNVKALEENPNAQMKDFWKLGLVLYKLYLYLGIYKSIIGFNDFYFKGVNLPVFVLTLYWRLIKVMGDFALKVEGQKGCTIDTKDFPKNGKLKATIKRRNGKKHTVFWDLNKTQSRLDEEVFKLAETLNNEEKSDS